VRVTNPLAEDEAFLRGDLLTTLISRAEYNLARMQGNVRLFEIGTAFFAGEDPAPASWSEEGRASAEEMHVAALVMGQRSPTHFTNPLPDSYDEWDLKYLADVVATAAFPSGAVQLIPRRQTRCGRFRLTATRSARRAASTLDAPVWAKPAFGLELNLEALVQGSATSKAYRAIPATPRAQVDLALLAPTSVTAAQIDGVIRRESG